jgi:hypothetical protein
MKRILLAVACMTVLTACRPDDQKTGTVATDGARETRANMSPELKMHLDSGNAAFRRKEYPAARTHYEAATRVDKKQAAGWFGLYMVELASGNAEAAGKALKRAQELVPGATLIHPNKNDAPPNPHPAQAN